MNAEVDPPSGRGADAPRTMRVDLVTGPVRYPTTPLFVLLAASLVPVVLLTVVLIWSDTEADQYEAAQDGVPDDPPDDSATPPPSRRLTTPVLAYRRAPDQLAAEAADRRLAEAMEQLYGFVEDGSCVAVGVDGRTVTTRHPTDPVIPASTHKLLVAAVALDRLGSEYRFTTSVKAPAAVDGVIDGDLYLVGGGDPLLTSDDFPIENDDQPAFNTTSLDALADAVVATGVTTIRGSVVGDGSRYDDEWTIASWAPGVARVDGGPYDALFVNDARTLGRIGRQSDPNDAAAREFARLLADRGVRVSNGWSTAQAPTELPVIASIESVTLPAVLDEMLTTSDNDTAEMLVKELGVADSGEGTLGAGLDVIARTLLAWGVPMEGVRLVDGSGLSAENRVTCATLVAVLQHIDATSIVASLPVAGRTGTLADEFVGSAVEGRLVAKTGTLGNPPPDVDPPAVKGLAGYLDAEDGSTIQFVMILNGDGVSEPDGYRPYWDALAIRLAEYPIEPDPATLGPR